MLELKEMLETPIFKDTKTKGQRLPIIDLKKVEVNLITLI